MIITETVSGGLEIRLDSTLYNEAVVYKSFYWYGAKYDVVVEKGGEGCFVVQLVPKDPTLTPEHLAELKSRVKRDLVDFKTRDIVARETQVVRELLVAKAFANSDEYDEPVIGSIADPGGLDPGAQDGPR